MNNMGRTGEGNFTGLPLEVRRNLWKAVRSEGVGPVAGELTRIARTVELERIREQRRDWLASSTPRKIRTELLGAIETLALESPSAVQVLSIADAVAESKTGKKRDITLNVMKQLGQIADKVSLGHGQDKNSQQEAAKLIIQLATDFGLSPETVREAVVKAVKKGLKRGVKYCNSREMGEYIHRFNITQEEVGKFKLGRYERIDEWQYYLEQPNRSRT